MGNRHARVVRALGPTKATPTLSELIASPPCLYVPDFGTVRLHWLQNTDTTKPRVLVHFKVELDRDDDLEVISRAIGAHKRCVQNRSSATLQNIKFTVDLTNELDENHESVLALVITSLLESIERGAVAIVQLHRHLNDHAPTPLAQARVRTIR